MRLIRGLPASKAPGVGAKSKKRQKISLSGQAHLCAAMSRPICWHFRFKVLFQWFLMLLSVLRGRGFGLRAMTGEALPSSSAHAPPRKRASDDCPLVPMLAVRLRGTDGRREQPRA